MASHSRRRCWSPSLAGRVCESPWLSGDLWAETPRAPSDLLLSGNLSQITRREASPANRVASCPASTPRPTVPHRHQGRLSRIDTKADALLDPRSPARGQVALGSARVAHKRYRAKFTGPGWQRLRDRGSRPQRPLWASTGTKNSAYSDVLYIAELIGPDVVSTMPEHTLREFADHGAVARTLDADPDGAERMLAAAAASGPGLAAITAQLEREGIRSFCDSYHQLLGCIERKIAAGAAR